MSEYLTKGSCVDMYNDVNLSNDTQTAITDNNLCDIYEKINDTRIKI